MSQLHTISRASCYHTIVASNALLGQGERLETASVWVEHSGQSCLIQAGCSRASDGPSYHQLYCYSCVHHLNWQLLSSLLGVHHHDDGGDGGGGGE